MRQAKLFGPPKIMEEKLSDAPNILKRIREKRIGGKVVPDAPKVSVIIPAYNTASFIGETLDSVFRQTYKNFEVILINDGSEDTPELQFALAPFFDKIIYAEQANSGAAKARNTAICLSRGSLLAFLDGDDIWSPDFLASQMRAGMPTAETFGGETDFGGKSFLAAARISLP